MTSDYETILIATDFSQASKEAARLALRLAGPNAVVRLMHVVPRAIAPPDFYGSVFAERLLFEASEDLMKESATRLLALASELGVRAEVRVAAGSVGALVAEEAEAFGADLVAIGAHGDGFHVGSLGSKSASILHAVRGASVLVGRGHAARSPAAALADVVAATDFSIEGNAALEVAKRLAAREGARLHLVHALDPSLKAMIAIPAGAAGSRPDVAAAQALDSMRSDRRKSTLHVLAGDPGREIPKFAERVAADLVVIGARGTNAIERLVLGSVADAIVNRAPCNVLVAR